ncbi:hypothetical protein QWJ46_29670, partial [Rhizobium sp. CBN3]|uniref:hypothetical protein n=1 Tax=Rhizobium sp. CBN3 TaxID=3058045 RepID=UPI0026726D28
PVARQAHNLKAAGSNPAPATKLPNSPITEARLARAFCLVTGRGVNASSGACKQATPTPRDRKTPKPARNQNSLSKYHKAFIAGGKASLSLSDRSSSFAKAHHNLKGQPANGSNPASATKIPFISCNTTVSYRRREDFIFAGPFLHAGHHCWKINRT